MTLMKYIKGLFSSKSGSVEEDFDKLKRALDKKLAKRGAVAHGGMIAIDPNDDTDNVIAEAASEIARSIASMRGGNTSDILSGLIKATAMTVAQSVRPDRVDNARKQTMKAFEEAIDAGLKAVSDLHNTPIGQEIHSLMCEIESLMASGGSKDKIKTLANRVRDLKKKQLEGQTDVDNVVQFKPNVNISGNA